MNEPPASRFPTSYSPSRERSRSDLLEVRQVAQEARGRLSERFRSVGAAMVGARAYTTSSATFTRRWLPTAMSISFALSRWP